MSSFLERQKTLFNQLKDAEDQCNFSKTNTVPDSQDFGVIDRRTYRKLKSEMKQFRGRESIYKRPEANMRECLRAKTIPDHMKNPQKWTYYSLSDVTPDQMSDSTNTATALAFIRQMEEKQASKEQMETNSDDFVFKKPVFHISSNVKRDNDEKVKPIFENKKVIMPEYVVGVTQKKEKKQIVQSVTSKDTSETSKKVELKLNHLYDDEDEE